MICSSHLALHEASVLVATEWNVNPDAWLFLRVLQGAGCAFRGTSSLLLNEGDALVNAPGIACQLRASQLGALRVQYFQVLPELLTGVLSASERQHLERAAKQGRGFPRHLTASTPFARQFAELDRQVTAGQTLLARCEMLHLSAMILTEQLPPPASQPNQMLTAQQRFEMMITQMVESELLYQSPAVLAQQCGCSVRHFNRLFYNQFGHSFVPGRIELYLQKAKQLLEETDGKVIDVAMDSGFNHVGFFTSRFKKRFGCTPSEWRKRKEQTAKANGKHRRRTAVAPRHLLATV